MRRALLIGLAGLALTACGKPEPAPAAKAPAAGAKAQWGFAIGKNSVELAWLDDPTVAESPFRLICARGEGFMVVATAFSPIASEERLSVGAGGDAFALVAVAGKGPNGPLVRATGPADEPLLTALDSGQPIAASYGAQTFGPVAAPPPAVRRAFTQSCRKLNGGAEI
ncbi:MAG: hypothetical protein Q7T19_03870 [Caulobacter sp.]|nr:hypothetical protein [Caulobacter sp.]